MPTLYKKYKKHKKIWIVVSGFLVFILVVLLIIHCMANSLITTINKQLSALRSSDMTLAYSYTSKDFRKVTSLSDFADFVDHYSALKNNKKAIFIEKKIKDDNALVKGVVYAADGSVTPIEYILVKEEDVWKIMGIQVNPVDAVTSTANNGSLDRTLSEDSTAMTKVYDNADSRYTLNYSPLWEYEKTSDGTIIFSGKRGTPAFYSTVNIQTVLSTKTGGDFSRVNQFMADIKHQAVSQSAAVKFLENGPVEITEKNGAKDKGSYTVFTYQYKGKVFKQWQVVILRNDQQVFYAWAYTSPLDQYESDLMVAKAMFASWTIY
jgi:hypothetical protein